MISRWIAAIAVTASLAVAAPAAAEAADGAQEKHATTSVAETVDAFVAVLEKKGATVFSVVDHTAGAQKAGMELAPATLVIFGNPKIGTPMMQAAPSMGIDLPMKALFLDDGDGGTRILYTDIAIVAARHGLAWDHPAVTKAAGALDGLTSAVAK